jgi:hypothetical protein
MAIQPGVPDPPPGLAKKPIKPGEKSDRVRTFQQLLFNRGFTVKVDGHFGPSTTSAYRVAQLAVDVDPSRLFENVGPIIWERIGKLKRVRSSAGDIIRPVVWKPKVLDCREGQHGMVRHSAKRWGKRSWGGVDYVLGHYTGNLVPFARDAQFHVKTNYLSPGGAPAIAYHIGIDVSGVVYIFNQHDDLCWHCNGGRNTNTLGIVFMGNHGGMTAAQRKSMDWLVKKLRDGKLGYGYPKLAHKGATTHRHAKPTSCPGDLGEQQYRKIFASAGLIFDTTPRRGG